MAQKRNNYGTNFTLKNILITAELCWTIVKNQ